MTASKQISVLSVRLPAAELRRIKSMAARRGVTLQQAVQQALQGWAFNPKSAHPVSLDALEGSLAGVDVEKIMREDRKVELAKDRARAR